MANELVARYGLRVSGSTFISTVNTDQSLLSNVLTIDPSNNEVKDLSLATFAADFITGGTLSGTGNKDLVLEQYDGSSVTISDVNIETTGGTYTSSTGIIEFTQNDGSTFNVSGWTYLESASISQNDITLTDNAGSDTVLNIDAITGATFDLASGDITWEGSNNFDATLSLGTDFVTGVTNADNVVTITKNGGASSNFTIDAITGLGYDGDWALSGTSTGVAAPAVELPFITGGSYNAGTITLSINDGVETDITITGLTTTDTHVTGGTLTQSTGEIELEFNQGYGPVTLTGAFEFVTGGTLTDNGITLETNLGNTDSLGTVTALTGLTQTDNDVSFDGSNGATGSIAINAVTGGTFDASTGIITVEGSNTITNIDLGTDFVTGVTEANNIITVGNAGAGTTDYNIQAFTGATISGNDITLSGSDLLDVTLNVSAITEVAYSDWGISGSSFNVAAPSFELPFITGGSYNQSTGDLTLSINDGVETDIVISGFEGADTYVTGGTLSQSAGTVTLEYTDNDFGPVTLDNAFEFVTGGTLTDNGITLETNLGNTDSLGTVVAFTAFTQTGNDVEFVGSNIGVDTFEINAITGATFSLATGDISWEGSNNYDLTLSLGTDFVTGVTEANNVISVTKNGGATATSTIQAVTAITYNNDWDIAFDGTGTLSTSPVELPFVTGGTYSSGTITLGINGALESDITITGITSTDTHVTGATVDYTGATLELNQSAPDVLIDSEQTIRVTRTSGGTLFNVSPSNYSAVHVEYSIIDGANARSGFFTAVFNNSDVEFADFSTVDIGTVSGELSADASGNVIYTGSGTITANTRAVAI